VSTLQQSTIEYNDEAKTNRPKPYANVNTGYHQSTDSEISSRLSGLHVAEWYFITDRNADEKPILTY